MEDYVAALSAAGWTVLYPPSAKTASDSQIIARYAKNGRDIWARLYYEFGANLSFSVADVGGENWAARLARDCKVPLYGVFFDFNKATLKLESEPVLNRALALLQGNTEKVEIRGHTDSVGGDAANLTLSEARAAAVRTWLVSHGVDGARIASRGYGKTQPVADNSTDAGRAKNRRVELAKATCATH
ncbi:MAG: OmpA family protein [Vicinamibacteria bacterium]|nr:OmpA family protein [Vicinamibacteria bacterium]